MDKFLELYEKSPLLSSWVYQNQPDENLIYKSGVISQSDLFNSIATILGIDEPKVVSHHYSKSVKLPVVAYLYEYKMWDPSGKLLILVRDNFHDLNCTILSSHYLNPDVGDVYPEVSKEWLEEERHRALNYIGKTAFELPNYDRAEERIEEYRRIAEAKGWSWMYDSWSSNYIIERDGRFFAASRAFWEGNPGAPINFYKGNPSKDFTFVTGNNANLISVIDKSKRALRYATRKDKD